MQLTHKLEELPDTDMYLNMCITHRKNLKPSRTEVKEKRPTVGFILNKEKYLMNQKRVNMSSRKIDNDLLLFKYCINKLILYNVILCL
jgi:hypothetical protein